MKYFAKIKYLGTAFHGYQVQPNKRTVMGELLHVCDRSLAELANIRQQIARIGTYEEKS